MSGLFRKLTGLFSGEMKLFLTKLYIYIYGNYRYIDNYSLLLITTTSYSLPFYQLVISLKYPSLTIELITRMLKMKIEKHAQYSIPVSFSPFL